MTWTIERVREELPEIDVLLEHELVPGQVTGRKLDFPRVYFRNGHRTTTYVEVSWPTLVGLLNTGTPLDRNS